MTRHNAVKLAALTALIMTSTAHAAFSEHETVGQKIISHTSSNGVEAICVLPTHFPDALYLADDDKIEGKLCSMERGVNVAMCAKTVSTNPGVDISSIPDGMTAAHVEAGHCAQKSVHTIAKYKLSTSCSYVPSILGYYHVSRMLGGIADVSQSVLHTMDRKEHLLIAKDGLARTKPTDIIHQTWGTLMAILSGSLKISADKRAAVMTSEGDQSYGAYIVSDKDQIDYKELFNGQSNPALRVQAFMAKNPAYLGLKHVGPIRDIVPTDFNAVNLQRLVRMRDVADMAVIDTIMSQQDRFGNINGRIDYAVKDADGIRIVKKAEATAGAIPVKVMLLRDNDCGVNKTNIEGQAKMVEGLRHISPTTYTRLMALAKAATQASTAQFFKRELVFTALDYANYQKNVAHVAGVLHAACKAGTLQQDLDVSAHFTSAPAPTACD